jgi:hypothetical protein
VYYPLFTLDYLHDIFDFDLCNFRGWICYCWHESEIKDSFDSNDGRILNKLNTENSQESNYVEYPVPSSENPIHSTELSKMLQTENIEREEKRKLIEDQNNSK